MCKKDDSQWAFQVTIFFFIETFITCIRIQEICDSFPFYGFLHFNMQDFKPNFMNLVLGVPGAARKSIHSNYIYCKVLYESLRVV